MKEIIVQIFFIVIEWSTFYECMFTWFKFEESHSSFEFEESHSSFKYEESHSSFEYEESHSSLASRQHFCYAPVLSTNTSHLVISSSLSIKQACLTVLITHQSIEFLDSLIMLRFSASELKNEQKISNESSIERFTKRFTSWYSHHDLKTT
jgi:hypothetical protein